MRPAATSSESPCGIAISRAAGWLAHWKELLEQDQKIARPRQLYTGPGERDYVDIDNR